MNEWPKRHIWHHAMYRLFLTISCRVSTLLSMMHMVRMSAEMQETDHFCDRLDAQTETRWPT